MATDTSKPKSKGGRPRNPPPAPAQGIAERSGAGWKFTIVLGGLRVNGKRFDPQAGAELLAGMLEDGMRRIQRSEPSTEKALEDLEAADAATNGDGHVPIAESGDVITSPSPAMTPGENGHH